VYDRKVRFPLLSPLDGPDILDELVNILKILGGYGLLYPLPYLRRIEAHGPGRSSE
jgi:hypothetical protein